jgi:uncharacterized protein with von Willebrand factor type A (vWA) domain
MRRRVGDLVARLRSSGVPVSVAETLDAFEALAVTGMAREPLREALAATLVKDQAHRAAFEEAFAAAFQSLASDERGAASAAGTSAGEGRAGAGRQGGGPGRPGREPPPESVPAIRPRERLARWAERPAAGPRGDDERPAEDAQRGERGDHEGDHGGHAARDELRGAEEGESRMAAASGRLRREASLLHRPFGDLLPDEIGEIRALARALARRHRGRRSRRLRRSRRGRADVRRSLRRAVSTGGVPFTLVRRQRKPGRPDLVALVDLSWSTRLAADLLLSLLLPSRDFFRRVRLLGYVGEPAEISVERGHVVPHEPLDFDARSDFGRVLVRLRDRTLPLSRNAVLLIMGDARNNRRPPRVDAFRRLTARAGLVAWLVPEPRARWGTGDSALPGYAPEVDLLLEAPDLGALARALDALAGTPLRRRRASRRPRRRLA